MDPKESVALQRIEGLLATHERPLILFSGGKDSLVLAHLVRQIGADCPAFSEISVLFPEDEADVRQAAGELGLAPHWHRELTGDRLAVVGHEFLPPAKYIYNRVDRRRHLPAIARHLREGGYDLALFGRRHQENTVPAAYYRPHRWRAWSAHPLIDWRHEDIWGYLDRHRVFRPRCYGQGSKQLRTWLTFLASAYVKDPATFIGQLYFRYPGAVQELAKFYEPAADYLRNCVTQAADPG